MDTETPRLRRIRPTTESKIRDRRLIDKDLLDGYLTVIAENNEKLAELQKEQADAMAALFKVMRANKLSEWEISKAKAKITVPKGRASTFIDPQTYRKYVTAEEFYESVSVSITQAKKHLSQKEIEKIAVVTPGKDGEPQLNVEYR